MEVIKSRNHKAHKFKPCSNRLKQNKAKELRFKRWLQVLENLKNRISN
jgi:hypothetical protein